MLTTVSAQNETNTLAVAGSLVKAKNPISVTPEEARGQLVESLILLKKSIGIKSDTKDDFKGSLQEFFDFIRATEGAIQQRLQALKSDDVNDKLQMSELNECIAAANILKSAACLTETNSGIYVKQKDLAGREIVAFALDELKNNARYGFYEPYSEGFARVTKDQVFGYLNYCGNEAISCQYETAQPFNNGKALVKKVNWFFVNASGKESEALLQVTNASALKNGISIAQFTDGKFALIDNNFDVTKLPISAKYDEIIALKGTDLYKMRIGNKMGLMTLMGEVKLDVLYQNIEHTNMSHVYSITQDNKIGFMNNEWKVQFAPIFNSVGEVDKNGLAIAKEGDKYCLISFKTFQKSELYNGISAFGDKKITVIQGNGGLLGLLDMDFKLILTPQYFSIGSFNQYDLAEACKLEKKCGFINSKGIEVITPVYEEIGKFNQHGLVVVSELTKDCNKNKNCKTDIVYNKFGQIIIAKANETDFNTMKIRYELDDTLHSNKFIVVKMSIDDKPQGFHLIDKRTFKLITNVAYNGVTPFDINGYLRVKKGEKWGIIDTLGGLILEPTYKEIRKLTDGLYGVKNQDDKYGFIDNKNKIIIPFEYDDVKYFKKGHCIVSKGHEKWGLINRYNAKIIPISFKSVGIQNGTYDMKDEKGSVYVVDEKGDCQGQNCAKFEEIRKAANN